jgi:hypothetical protein
VSILGANQRASPCSRAIVTACVRRFARSRKRGLRRSGSLLCDRFTWGRLGLRDEGTR